MTAILNALVLVLAFIVNPFINLFNPALPEFVPAPEIPPAHMEKYSIADYKIIYGAGADATEIKAAGILADTLNRITGLAYAAEEGLPSGSEDILIGQVSGVDVSGLGADGYIIDADGGNIIITGGLPRGVLYGVHQFLYKYFDCRWYTADLIVLPAGPAEIAEIEPEQYIPPLEYREMDWLSRSDPVYSVANGLNGNIYHAELAAIPDMGGVFGYNGSFAHTIINQFIKPAEFFDEHPDWYAYRDSSKSRVPKQLCLTNPEVLAEMIKEVRWYLGNGNGQPIVSITQDDNTEFCQCPNCKKVD
ncbi:MAG: DUF4838 domain-containing protein, partial [Oscillospiraceae bacterium]|nr:DUF4838 domain-containing protein [Oscillospiraceae bacterium]